MGAWRAASSALLFSSSSPHSTQHTHTHTHNQHVDAPRSQHLCARTPRRGVHTPSEQGALSKSKTEAKYNKKEVLKLKEVFDDADKDGSGEIEPSELQDSLKKTNLGAEAVDMFKSMDRDGSKRIDFSEYLRVGERGNLG